MVLDPARHNTTAVDQTAILFSNIPLCQAFSVHSQGFAWTIRQADDHASSKRAPPFVSPADPV